MENKDKPTYEELLKKDEKNKKIIKALMQRVEESMASTGNAFSLFEGNIILSKQVKERTDALKRITLELEKEKRTIKQQNRDLIHAKKEISENSDYIQGIINSISDSLIVTDRKGMIKDVNHKLIEILGIDKNCICDLHIDDLLYFMIDDAVKKDFKFEDELSFILKEKSVHFKEVVLSKNGIQLSCLLSGSILKSKDERSDRIIFLLKDMTKIKEMESMIDQERVKSMQSAKLASLGEMAGGIAHEINNPITIMATILMLMKRKIEADDLSKEDFLEKAQQLEDTLKRVSKIISGLRTITRRSDGETHRPVLINEVIQDVLGLCGEKFKSHGVELRICIEDDALAIPCDQVQISQVLLNLLSNSYDAIIDNKQEDMWIQVNVKEIKEMCHIEVMDSGDGIDEATRDKIFNPFFTSKDIGKGTGLGLSLSKSIIEKHKGTLELQRSQNTCFLIKLPSNCKKRKEAA